MKKIYVCSLIVIMAVGFSYCHTAKKAAAAPLVTYATGVQPIMMGSCSPCHIPAKGGNKEAYDNYASVKKDVDEILRRIQLNPDQMGFMPMRHPKLSDSAVAIIKQWKDNGLVEK